MSNTTAVETLVIGGGQAGLATGYHLAQAGRDYLIVDAAERVGGSWHHRWDSMRVFTPSTHDGLPGRPYPGGYSFPSATDIAAYLADYAEHFELRVRTGFAIDGLFREGDGFLATSGTERILAANVVLATGPMRQPRLPAFAGELSREITQLHSSAYRRESQLKPGPVLVVGAGNSGADIALDVVGKHEVLLAGRHPGHIPVRIESRRARAIFPLLWFAWSHVLTENTPPGRKVRDKHLNAGDALIRVKPKELDQSGVKRAPRVTGVVEGLPQTEDGQVHDVPNVVWATGFLPTYSWIDVPGVPAQGRIESDRGCVKGVPGLYVLGQLFQHSFASHTIGGVGRDAAYVVRDIVSRQETGTTPEAVSLPQ